MKDGIKKQTILEQALQRVVKWLDTGGLDLPWQAVVDGKTWRVRLNNFPEEPFLYTLFIEGGSIGDFNDWPHNWSRPSPS